MNSEEVPYELVALVSARVLCRSEMRTFLCSDRRKETPGHLKVPRRFA